MNLEFKREASVEDVGFEVIRMNTNFIALGMDGITKRRDNGESLGQAARRIPMCMDIKKEKELVQKSEKEQSRKRIKVPEKKKG